MFPPLPSEFLQVHSSSRANLPVVQFPPSLSFAPHFYWYFCWLKFSFTNFRFGHAFRGLRSLFGNWHVPHRWLCNLILLHIWATLVVTVRGSNPYSSIFLKKIWVAIPNKLWLFLNLVFMHLLYAACLINQSKLELKLEIIFMCLWISHPFHWMSFMVLGLHSHALLYFLSTVRTSF